ncbi:MAG: hypothetical protein V3V76_01710, partial [Candidatus Adiutricales bacterium]
EYFISFIYWSNILDGNFDRYFSKEDYARLDRSNPLSFYEVAKRRERELDNQSNSALGDHSQQSEAITKILNHPFRHLLTTIPFAWKGMQVQHPLFLPWIFFIALFLCFSSAVFRKDYGQLFFYLPSIYSFSFMTFFTHNPPRYNAILIPILHVALVYCLWKTSLFLKAKNITITLPKLRFSRNIWPSSTSSQM